MNASLLGIPLHLIYILSDLYPSTLRPILRYPLPSNLCKRLLLLNNKRVGENPAYGRQRISRRMQIVEGLTNERPWTDHVIWWLMRGLKINYIIKRTSQLTERITLWADSLKIIPHNGDTDLLSCGDSSHNCMAKHTGDCGACQGITMESEILTTQHYPELIKYL